MTAPWHKLGLFWILCACSFISITLCLRSYSVAINDFGDSAAYVSIAKAIATWHFAGVHVLQFWGVSFAIALIALIGHVPLIVALIVVSAGSSAAVTVLAGRLWGWYVAALMTAMSFDWMQRSLLGGSEPLFCLLLLAAFLAIRREYWWTGALLAAFATTVRPLGICALVAIGLVLLYRKEYNRFGSALITGLLVGALYMVPLHLYLHDSMATVHSYETATPLFWFPFHAILQGLFSPHPLTNLVLSCSWIVFIVTGIALLTFSKSCREFRHEHTVEFLFAVLYTFVICCYNYPQWALGSFARFSIPVIPLALIGYRQFFVFRKSSFRKIIARREAIVWTCAVVFPVLAAFSAYGIRNVLK